MAIGTAGTEGFPKMQIIYKARLCFVFLLFYLKSSFLAKPHQKNKGKRFSLPEFFLEIQNPVGRVEHIR